MRRKKSNGNLVLTRRNDDLVRVTIPLARLEQLVKERRDAYMDIRTYGFNKDTEGVDEVKLAFMDRERNFDIQRNERFASHE